MTEDDWRSVAAWTSTRHLLDGDDCTPQDVLATVPGIYHFEPTATLSILARSPRSTASDVQRLQTTRAAIRIPAMRGSVFLVPTALAGTLISACHLGRRRQGSLPVREIAALTTDILEAAAEPATAAELAAATGDPRRRGFVEPLCDQGLLLRLSGFGRTRYTAARAWLGEPLPIVDPADALADLVRLYWRAYGPASMADFIWWSGLGVKRCRAAINRHQMVDLDDGLLLLGEQEQDYRGYRKIPRPTVCVLPRWDALTMGYAPTGRRRILGAVSPEVVYDHGGDGAGVILRDSQVAGTWQALFAVHSAEIVVRPIGHVRGVEVLLNDLMQRLGKGTVRIRFDDR